ncbi:tRNA modification GTPase [Lignipirellula cremea]|nr:tRNA modification GTPase [Lignipirellula cremea]
MDFDDTITAIASAPGGAVRGVVRISGPQAVACLADLFQGEISPTTLRKAGVLQGALALGDPLGDAPCQAFVWPTDRSYTRQPSVEIHTIGSPPVLEATLAAVRRGGARLARPGEFTQRAFLAGRIDLTQAEAVLGVIDADSQNELTVALRQMAGGLAEPLQELRDRLLNLLADLEAGLDFVEEDIEFITTEQLTSQLREGEQQVAALAEQMRTRSDGPGEIRIAISGWPNVGKSSLLNALAGESAAIVSPLPGATRDYVARRLDLHGLSCLVIDTAGFEADAAAGVADAAQSQMRRQTGDAHLRLFCLDSSRPLNAWEEQQLSEPDPLRLRVLTKGDQAPRNTSSDPTAARRNDPLLAGAMLTSSRTGAGLEELKQAIASALPTAASGEAGVVAGTASRCRESLELAAASLATAGQTAAAGWGDELTAAEIRTALAELGRVVGAVYTDDLLDRIFSRFCIGK